jgi:glutathione S-transferase
MLAELGLAYETKSLDMMSGEHKKPEFLAINPAGQIPAMVYDGFTLTESAAISRYLAEKNKPELLGATPEIRATGMRWELFTLLNLNPHFTTLALEKWGRPVSGDEKAKANEALSQKLPVLEGWLAKNAWVAGDAFTVADLNVRATFDYAGFIEYDLSAYPAISAWAKKCADRPAYVSSHAA